MTARLTFVCHAPTAATRAARFPADEAPEAAALARASSLAPPASGRWFAGPERRARDTAAAMTVRFDVDADLRDQDFGRWAGRSLADLAAAEPDAVAVWAADPAAAPHGGESVADLLARVAGWMAGRAAVGGRATVVTHPAVVRAAAVAALGAGPASFWRIEAPPLARASCTHDGRRWALAGLVPPP